MKLNQEPTIDINQLRDYSSLFSTKNVAKWLDGDILLPIAHCPLPIAHCPLPIGLPVLRANSQDMVDLLTPILNSRPY
jgi:hypothetical protein